MTKGKKLKILAICFIVSIVIDISKFNVSANENINFRNMGMKDGLSQATAEVIFQDSKGYMWIGTADGLNRYDGYNFKIYKYSEELENSLTNNSIVDIKEDKSGHIWVATSNGLNKIDTFTGKIKKYTDYTQGGSLSNFNITQILISDDGQIIVGTTDGLNKYDEKKEIDNIVMISVKDNGIGIDEEYIEFIFDRVNQVIDSNNEIKGGSGLGLTITKQIIELHKGNIYVESKVGKGSNFIINLPLISQ